MILHNRVQVFIYVCQTAAETGVVFGMNNACVWHSVEFSRQFYPALLTNM